MINFQLADKKSCIVERDGNRLVNLKLKKSTIPNDFEIIIEFIKKLSQYHGKDFDDWFEDFLVSCRYKEPDRFNIMDSNIPIIKDFVNDYIDHLGIDFSKFVDVSKIKGNTIVFSKEEIEFICKASCYLKVYAIIFNSENICLDEEAHKEIYNKIIDNKLLNIIDKIFNLIQIRTYLSKSTDKLRWDSIDKTKDEEYIIIVKTFNSIMNDFLIRCEVDRNPIKFFVACIDNNIKWDLISAYKQKIIYVDSTDSDDVDSLNFKTSLTGISYDKLKTFGYNYTLHKLKKAAFDYLFKKVGGSKEKDRIHSRLHSLQYISPVCYNVAFPILSNITRVPYEYISEMMSPKHATVLQYMLTICFLLFLRISIQIFLIFLIMLPSSKCLQYQNIK